MEKAETTEYLSLDIVGADEKNYKLPHLTTKAKYEPGRGLVAHLVGVLMHALVPQLWLFTTTDNHTTGSNHTVEFIHRVINYVAKSGQQRTLFLQLDNCTR